MFNCINPPAPVLVFILRQSSVHKGNHAPWHEQKASLINPLTAVSALEGLHGFVVQKAQL